MIDKDKIAKYIEKLRIYLSQLDEFRNISEDEFVNDWKIYDLIDRKLHLIIELMLNISEIIISEYGFKKPDYYAEIPEILYNNKKISSELKEQLIDLARFRNVLVHDYLYLDHHIIYKKFINIYDIANKFIDEIKENI